MQRMRNFARQLPTFFFAFILALTVWVVAVTSNDPSVQKPYPGTVTIEVVGQAPDMVLTSSLPAAVAVTLRAPNSIWSSLIDEKAPVRAILDLSGLSEGTHTVPIQIEVGIKPAEVVSFNPRSVDIMLEPLATSQFNINVINNSNPAIGYEAGIPKLDQTTATVSGAASLVNSVNEIRATVDLKQATSDINQQVPLVAFDKNGQQVKGVTITPAKVNITESIAQQGGFRNVVVKLTTNGQPATGYRLTSITVNPPTVTVYSSNPQLVETLPGYVNTESVNLDGLKDDLNQQIGLLLPNGITVVGDPSVNVQVSISPIVNSLAFSGVPVLATGLAANLTATISPANADVIISGPLVTMSMLSVTDLQVLIDLTGMQPGFYTIQPTPKLNNPDLSIESIQPTTFKVTIAYKSASATTPP